MTTPDHRTTGQADSGRPIADKEKLVAMNRKLAQLAQVLIERLEGDDEEYEYSFDSGWHEEDDPFIEQLKGKGVNGQLAMVEEMIERYQKQG
jgi:hypothetical protein